MPLSVQLYHDGMDTESEEHPMAFWYATVSDIRVFGTKKIYVRNLDLSHAFTSLLITADIARGLA